MVYEIEYHFFKVYFEENKSKWDVFDTAMDLMSPLHGVSFNNEPLYENPKNGGNKTFKFKKSKKGKRHIRKTKKNRN